LPPELLEKERLTFETLKEDAEKHAEAEEAVEWEKVQGEQLAESEERTVAKPEIVGGGGGESETRTCVM